MLELAENRREIKQKGWLLKNIDNQLILIKFIDECGIVRTYLSRWSPIANYQVGRNSFNHLPIFPIYSFCSQVTSYTVMHWSCRNRTVSAEGSYLGHEHQTLTPREPDKSEFLCTNDGK